MADITLIRFDTAYAARRSLSSAAALGLVLTLHAAALYAVVRHDDAAAPAVSVPLTISLATASEPVRPAPKKTPPKPKPAAVAAARAAPMPEPQVAEPEPATEQPAPPKVVPPRLDAAYLNNPVPAYPAASRRLGEQGRTLLRVFVDADGGAQEVQLHTSSGHARLDRAAREAVERWRFAPARHGERAVGAWVVVPILFSLNS